MDQRMLKSHHSLQYQQTPRSSTSFDVYSKSDLDLALSSCSDPAEYYKRYEHDEVPVKDSNSSIIDGSMTPSNGSLTNSDLKKIETRVYQNISQELQTDEGSISSLESNIKFFKLTVEKIFDNFNTSIQDFELYKRRFHEILHNNNNRHGSIEDMEEFIKDMFEHILYSDRSISNISSISEDAPTPTKKDNLSGSGDNCEEANSSNLILDAYINEDYLSDSTFDDISPKVKPTTIEDLFNLLLLHNPSVRKNDIHSLSELNIRKPNTILQAGTIASAENFKKLAAKRLENGSKEIHDDTLKPNNNLSDRDIPVKVSFAKKNIYLNEDFTCKEHNEHSKSLLSKICSIICKTFRKQ